MTGKDRPTVPAGEDGSISWVCGEVATVEVEIRNPTVIPIKVCAPREGIVGVDHPTAIPLQCVSHQSGNLNLVCIMHGGVACGVGGTVDTRGGMGWTPVHGAT